MSSVDPKTLAIGGAVLVAGVGAYMLLREGSGSDSLGTQVLPGDKDDCPVDARTGALEKVAGPAGVIMGPFVGIVASVAAKFATQTPSMDELNSLRSNALTAGKAAVAAGDYPAASKQYTLLRAYEKQVQDNRAASALTSHQKDPFCQKPLSGQLLALMTPMMEDMLSKTLKDQLDAAETNMDNKHYKAAEGILWAFKVPFDAAYQNGGGITKPFMMQLKKRYETLKRQADEGLKVEQDNELKAAIYTALQSPSTANMAVLGEKGTRIYTAVYPLYAQYLAKKDSPNLDERVAVSKKLLEVDWLAAFPEIKGFIDKTAAEYKAHGVAEQAALTAVKSTITSIGAGLEHLLALQNKDSIYTAVVDQYMRWTPAQQKQYVDSLTPDQKKAFMVAIRNAKQDRS
jgi:hypothetical protein